MAAAPARVRPDAGWLLRLQRTAGNGAVNGLLAGGAGRPPRPGPSHGHAAPARVVLAAPSSGRAPVQRGVEGEGATADWVDDLRRDLRGLGVKEAQLGDPEAIRALGQDTAQDLLDKLRAYMGDRALGFTSSSNIVTSWNIPKDDLGVGGRSGYRTILHYVRELDRLSRASLGKPWPEAIRELRRSTVNLAGAKFYVHPRMLYFAAAAQIGADDAAGLGDGEGHYLAPAAVFDEIRSIGEAATDVHQLGEAQEAKHDPDPPAGAAAVYDDLVLRLLRVIRLGFQQQAVESGQVAHHEPGLAAYVNDRSTAIFGLPPTAMDDAEGLQHCRKLLAVLGSRRSWPRRKQAHGRGAADPHGTHHAMGMALDVYYGTKGGGFANLGTKALKGEGAGDVVAWFLREFGGGVPELAGLLQLRPEVMLATLRGSNEASMAFAQLLSEHAGEGVARLDQAVADRRAPEHQEPLRQYRDLSKAVRRAVGVRQAKARKLLRSKAVARSLADVRGYMTTALKGASPQVVGAQRRPSSLVAAGRHAARVYDELHGILRSLELVAAGDANRSLHSTGDPSLSEPLSQIEDAVDQFDAVVDTEQLGKARQTMSSKLRHLLRQAAAGKLVMDQPPELVAGLTGVEGTRLQGWHHWNLADWRSTLTSQAGTGAGKAGYQDRLLADMRTRDQDQMRRILQVMVQSPAGYDAVFGDEKTELASIIPALRAWDEEKGAAGEKVDMDQLLQDVEDRLPPPALDGLSAPRKSLATSLYERGHYDVALAVAQGDAG